MTSLPESRGPFLLVATPELRDPNFRRSVVLVVSHSPTGSVGFVLNRPIDKALSDVLPDVDPRGARIPLFHGGPVQTDSLQFLGQSPPAPGVDVTTGDSLEELLERFPKGDGIHGYVGYAGWGEGQLENELDEGAWVVAAARARHVFDVPPGRLWSTVLRELGGRFTWMSLLDGDPKEN